LRIISCILSVVIALTVMLSGAEAVHAKAADINSGHHSVVSVMADSSSHTQDPSHNDICGMAVCGPYVQQMSGNWNAAPVLLSVKYWAKDRTLSPAELDVSVKPPRA